MKDWYKKYLDFLEHESCGRYTESERERKAKKLDDKMKEILPENFEYCGLPVFFQYIQPEQIKSVIVDSKKDEFLTVIIYFYDYIDSGWLKGDDSYCCENI